MNDPIHVLESEHVLHRRMLAVLERIASHVEARRPFPADDVARVLAYFREFVEVVHHAKEDGSVYPLVLAVGDEDIAEVIGRLIADHQATKELLNSLVLFWEPGELLEQERIGFCQLARAYSSRMRRHMDLEEAHLFPAAKKLAPDDKLAVVRQFETVSTGRRDLAHWAAIAADLEEHWIC